MRYRIATILCILICFVASAQQPEAAVSAQNPEEVASPIPSQNPIEEVVAPQETSETAAPQPEEEESAPQSSEESASPEQTPATDSSPQPQASSETKPSSPALKPRGTSSGTNKSDSIPMPEPMAWRNTMPLGERYRVPLDTLQHNFYQTDIPSAHSLSYSTTGNLGAAGFNNIYFERPEGDIFFFKDAFAHWLRSPDNFEWYNTRIPFTQVAYHTGSAGETAQDNLSATFSGNVNKQLEIGGGVNLVTGRGMYSRQADREFSYRLFGSYLGTRYQIQTAFNNYNYVTEENGGITDDRFILDPAAMQGGETKINTRTIPVKLNNAYNRLRGKDLYLTHRYNLGYYKEVESDSLTEEFVAVSSIIHTLTYEDGLHRFVNNTVNEDTTFFENTYLSKTGTNEASSYWALSNTVGISIHEGLSKYFPMGIGAYVTYQVREYHQATDTIAPGTQLAPHLSVHPDYHLAAYTTEHALWVGGQLWKRQGSWLTYEANVGIGILGSDMGEIDISGTVGTMIPLWQDSLSINANVLFKNSQATFFHRKYVSNHFMWNNDFGNTRQLRIDGEIEFPKTGTYIQAGFENLQNYVYFDNSCLPRQESGNIQVISATLRQDIKVGIFHLDLAGTYQFSSNQHILPLPQWSLYGNLYLLFPIAKVMHVQLGADCNWYSSFKAPAYQPALMTRYNQDEIEIGNYPFMNVYLNVKFKKARFYLLYSHVNYGWLGGNNYFSIPHYPLNPGIFQLGISVDFAN